MLQVRARQDRQQGGRLDYQIYFQLTVSSSGPSTGEHKRESSFATSPVRKFGFLSGKLATSSQSLGLLSLWVSYINIPSNQLHLDGLTVLTSGWYLASLGLWSMLYTPIHFAVFLIICFLLPSLLYSAYLLQTLYLVLGEAYIDVSMTSPLSMLRLRLSV